MSLIAKLVRLENKFKKKKKNKRQIRILRHCGPNKIHIDVLHSHRSPYQVQGVLIMCSVASTTNKTNMRDKKQVICKFTNRLQFVNLLWNNDTLNYQKLQPYTQKNKAILQSTNIPSGGVLGTDRSWKSSQRIYHPLHLSRSPGIWIFNCSLSENLLDPAHWLPHLKFIFN